MVEAWVRWQCNGSAVMILPIQGRQLFQKSRSRAQFTPLGALLLVVNGHRHRSAILVLGQREQADVIPNHLAIQCQRSGQTAGAALQPAG